MTAPTLPDALVLPDIDFESMIESALQPFECIGHTELYEHSGDKAALYLQHGCREGWICRGHLDRFIAWRPLALAILAEGKRLRCLECLGHFDDVDAFSKVYPL